MLKPAVIVVAALAWTYLVSFAAFRWQHRSQVNTGSTRVEFRTHLLVDSVTGRALRALYYPALALDARLTGRDTLFISHENFSAESLTHGPSLHC